MNTTTTTCRAAVVATSILFAGCSGSTAHAIPPDQHPTTTAPTSTPAPPTSTGSPPSVSATAPSPLPSTPAPSTPATSAAPAASTCAAADLAASIVPSSGAAGHESEFITLTNRSSQPCTMIGYPGVELLDTNGAPVVNAARGCVYIPCSTTAVPVSVAPGASAYFELVWQGNPPEPAQTTCPHGTMALVTPPNAYDQLHIPVNIAPCGLPPVFGVGTVQFGPSP